MRIKRISFLSKTYRNINRYRQILAVLFKYGFDSLIERLNLGHYLDAGIRLISRKQRERVEHLSRQERLRLVFEELGPTFIKMGQILSTRSDIFPVEFVRELEKLQDDVPPFPFAELKEIIERELGKNLHEIYSKFDENPLAAASIAQVHRAQLISGEEVIVKVQRPGIRKIIEVDLEILFHMSTLMEKYVEEIGVHRPTKIVEEFARNIEKEINFKIEAANMARFAKQFEGNNTIYVPRCFTSTSTERVITMEYVDGVKVSDIPQLEGKGLDLKLIASRGTELLLEQIFRHGFFHGDPHPGNVCIMPGNVICYLDFGIMGTITKKPRNNFADVLYGYAARDETMIASAILKIVEWEREPNRAALERDLSAFMESHLYKPLKEIRLGDLLKKFLLLFSNHNLRLPSDMFLVVKAIAEAEGIGLMLDPDFDMSEKVKPFVRRLKLERMHPRNIFSEVVETGGHMLQLLRSIPEDLQDILKQIKQGRTRIIFEHRGLNELIFELDRSSNRISFSLIIASLIIGSSLIITTNLGPYLFGFPLLGLAGYLIAGILGLWLLISIFRSGKL